MTDETKVNIPLELILLPTSAFILVVMALLKYSGIYTIHKAIFFFVLLVMVTSITSLLIFQREVLIEP